jgi:hypothetical protein
VAGEAPPSVQATLTSPGQPLTPAERTFFEPRFGMDFSQVRVHTNDLAQQSARDLHALAYTVGSHVVFGSGSHAPASTAGRRLLAHELTHVVQQSQRRSPLISNQSTQGLRQNAGFSISAGPPMSDVNIQAISTSRQSMSRQESAKTINAREVEVNDRPPGQAFTTGVPQDFQPLKHSESEQGEDHQMRTTQIQPLSSTNEHIQRQVSQPCDSVADTQERWNRLVELQFMPPEANREERAHEAIRRMLHRPEGERLIAQLWRLFCRDIRRLPRITASFVDERDGGWTEANGDVSPGNARANHYQIHIRNQVPRIRRYPGYTLHSTWGGGSYVINFQHEDPESQMASTLYHELLHIWFVNTQTNSIFPTGHGDVTQGEIEPLFYGRLRQFSEEIDALEREIHEVARRPDSSSTSVPAQDPPLSATISTRDQDEQIPSSEPLVSGSLTLQGGIGGGEPSGITGTFIVGADVLLRTFADLHLGARGIYLTPDQLFSGGTVGMRFLQGEADGRGQSYNPLFFDLEGGVVTPLTTAASARFSSQIVGLAQLGLGQEIGRQGPRFFWQIGGFVLVSDQPIGGATAGAGLRFP